MSTYFEDINAWALEQSELLKAGKFDQLDIENLLEELDCVVGRDFNDLRTCLIRTMGYMLIAFQNPGISCEDLNHYRERISIILHSSPSLRAKIPEIIREDYSHAQFVAYRESGREDFPATCPWTPEQILDLEYLA
ncbi:DUF29 domain-containing protein [Salmonella enterica]|nr:DUF29 domain-containing protein [Salmonella enterica]EHA9546186.1 DUF29 domain-containing protein [Salmonella enterica subsp. enterica serovar Braenderup]EBH4941567.1 DUF29 domain-containing protein [Salmonella enterica]ECK3278491.1 DUF29 domain-containing protein [Salmonella enterica]ECK6358159.1 DUF29 domain-containing protein [Salmonella enterica]